MAENDGNAPIINELLGRSGTADSLPARTGGQSLPATRPEDDLIGRPLHRLHESRMISSAGRMVIGSKMPTPLIVNPGRQGADGTQVAVFSSRSEPSGRGSHRGAALAACAAFALGSTALVTPATTPERSQIALHMDDFDREIAGDVTGSLPETTPAAQLLAVTQAPVGATRIAALSPGVAPRPEAETTGGFVRVAQQDSASLTVQNIFGPAGKPLPLSISLNQARPEDYSFLMFRGLPANVTLSSGFRLKESWAVSLRDIGSLALTAPASFQGSFNLEVLLIKGRDTPAESRVMTVEVLPPDFQLPATAGATQAGPGAQILTAAPPAAEPPRAAPQPRPGLVQQPQPPAPAAAAAGVAPAEEQTMMNRAAALLRSHDVSSARLLFEYLAKRGSAKAALAMGQSYDPAFFRTISAAGLRPDPELARQWYAKAAELGDKEAPGRLSALGTR
jgi:hypothetical protein